MNTRPTSASGHDTAPGASNGTSATSVSTPFLHPAVGRFDDRVDALASRLRGSAASDRVFYTLSQAANHSMLWHGINLVDAVVIFLRLGDNNAVINIRNSAAVVITTTTIIFFRFRYCRVVARIAVTLFSSQR